jgi:hypothetical protein
MRPGSQGQAAEHLETVSRCPIGICVSSGKIITSPPRTRMLPL